MGSGQNKFSVAQRLNYLEAQLQRLEDIQKRFHLAPDAVHLRGADGATGPQGIPGQKGERGDLTVVADAEVVAALNVHRTKHVKFLAALQHARELNNQQPSPALRKAIDSVLNTIEKESQ